MKKLSTLMLEGLEKVNGNGIKNVMFKYDNNNNIIGACAIGCVHVALFGTKDKGGFKSLHHKYYQDTGAFEKEYGVPIMAANDQGIPVDMIAGMLKAIGR